MTAKNPAEVLKQWLAAINGHDPGALAALMTVDHVFVDSLGNRVQRAPAAWRAVIRDGRVVEWQVFADNKLVYEILGRRRR